MPRARQALAEIARTHTVTDLALARAAGDEPEEDELEWSADAFARRLRTRWSTMGLPDRRKFLGAEVAAKFLKRFGVPWDKHRAAIFAEPPWPPAQMPWTQSRAVAVRSQLVAMLDAENVLGLPRRPDGTGRFLSVLEMTWVSILAGNWPEAARRRVPDAVLRAERELIKKALATYGVRPAEALGVERVHRGPRARELSRKK